MYVKVFKGPQHSECYTLAYMPNLTKTGEGKFFLTFDLPYNHTSIEVKENELYVLLDTFFREKQNEKGNE